MNRLPRQKKQMSNNKQLYKGVLRKKNNVESYDFNDLLHELKGNNLSRLTPYRSRYEDPTKQTIKNYLEMEITKINNTDEFL